MAESPRKEPMIAGKPAEEPAEKEPENATPVTGQPAGVVHENHAGGHRYESFAEGSRPCRRIFPNAGPAIERPRAPPDFRKDWRRITA